MTTMHIEYCKIKLCSTCISYTNILLHDVQVS